MANHSSDHHDHDHSDHDHHSPEAFRNRFWLSVALTLPILYLSAELQDGLGSEAASFPDNKCIASVLDTELFVYGG